MRILKYLLLILLLLFVGFSVFVSTQSADFNLVKSKIIKSSKVAVFNYVNDFSNWNSFISLNNPSKKYNFSTVTSGKGAIIDWSSLSESGKIKNVSVVENATINQNYERGSGVFDEPSVYEQTRDGEESNYRSQQQYNELQKQQYRAAMSTFDDEQSVSSMELLFNWLTCRENSFEEKKTGKKAFNPEGMEFDVLTHSSDPYAQHGICR